MSRLSDVPAHDGASIVQNEPADNEEASAARSPVEPLPRPGRRVPSAAAGWLIALLACSAAMSFYDLDGGAEFEPTDCWVSQTAREMSENSGLRAWVVPQFCDEVRAQKSPGPYWAVMLTSMIRGKPVDEFSTRIPNAIAALLLVWVVYWLTREIAGERAAIFGGFATASSVVVLHWSHRGAADLGVTSLMALSLAAIWIGAEKRTGRARIALWMLGYFAAGMAMLYKMPMPLVCVGLPAVAYVVLLRRWEILKSWWHLAGLGLFLLPWLPWVGAFLAIEPGAWYKWEAEFFDRFTGELPNVEEQKTEWMLYLLYVGCAFVFAVPFSLSIPQAIGRAFKPANGLGRRGVWFVLIWFLGLLVFFTLAVGKETRYFLPAMPPLFVLLGIELSRFFDPDGPANARLRRIGAIVAPLLVAGGFVGVAATYRKYINELAPYGMPAWSEWVAPLLGLGVIFTVGCGLSAWLFARRREHASFAALVGTMFAAWLWIWPTLMPIAMSQAPFKNFGAQLRELSPEHQRILRHIAQPDPRNVWYSDVRTPRLIDNIELTAAQQGDRSSDFERRYWGRKMIERLDSDELTLFVSGLMDYAAFHTVAPLELEGQGRSMPRTYVWKAATVGHPAKRYILYGNRPPPGAPPDTAWLEELMPKLRPRILKQYAKTSAAAAEAVAAGER
jgi:4-amino-4-deoxy-L-arabinose transferase-like glycosyltransferase